MAINSTSKRRRIQFIEVRNLESPEEMIWKAIISTNMCSCGAKQDL